VSTDGIAEARTALTVADDILTIAHRRQMTLPHIELNWTGGAPSLDIKWFPTIGPKEDAAALVAQVRSAFVPDDEEMCEIGTSTSYVTDLHGITVDFTVYTR
jgi:hypothetical protein